MPASTSTSTPRIKTVGPYCCWLRPRSVKSAPNSLCSRPRVMLLCLPRVSGEPHRSRIRQKQRRSGTCIATSKHTPFNLSHCSSSDDGFEPISGRVCGRTQYREATMNGCLCSVEMDEGSYFLVAIWFTLGSVGGSCCSSFTCRRSSTTCCLGLAAGRYALGAASSNRKKWRSFFCPTE
jgi:hypothetical protein